jgi:hypothetical protein
MRNTPIKPLFLSWLPALIGMGVLFYTSSLPGDRIHLPPFSYSDKAVHLTAYAVLGVLISLRKTLGRRLSGSGNAAGPAQGLDLTGLAADSLGVILGCWIYRWVLEREKRKILQIEN